MMISGLNCTKGSRYYWEETIYLEWQFTAAYHASHNTLYLFTPLTSALSPHGSWRLILLYKEYFYFGHLYAGTLGKQILYIIIILTPKIDHTCYDYCAWECCELNNVTRNVRFCLKLTEIYEFVWDLTSTSQCN